jgi:hypothetical protein
MNFEEVASNIRANMAAMEACKPTMQEAADAMATLGPAMQSAWEHCLADDVLWSMRAQKHGRLRTWLLHWKLT